MSEKQGTPYRPLEIPLEPQEVNNLNWIQKLNQTKNIEEGRVNGFDYNHESLRLSLLRKVYGIILLEVIVTLSLSCLATYSENVKELFLSNAKIIFAYEIFAVALAIFITIFKSVRRTHPMNLICLLVITLGFSGGVAFISAYFEHEKVLTAVILSSVMLVSLTLFTLQTNYSFFGFAPFILTGSLMLLIIYLQLVVKQYFGEEITIDNKQILKFSMYFGVFLFSIALIFHTQLLLGPKTRLDVFADDHVFIALTLYTDFVNLFLKVLFIV